jgi:hypothetical protein
MQLFTPREYLKIDIANSFGLDKKDWNERITWFDANQHQLESLLKQAETPALYYAGICAWRDVNQGIPSGYPISLDASASGLQLLACLTGDTQAAQLCGVISTGHREDAYTIIYESMLAQINTGNNVTREMAKRAVMTSLYGSTNVPKEVFGDGELLDIFYETMQNNAPFAWNLNQMFLQMWDESVIKYSWLLPDNFHVHCKVMAKIDETFHYLDQPYVVTRYENQGIKEGRSLGANVVHSLDGMIVREMTRRCSYDVDVMNNALNAVLQHGRDDAAEYVGSADVNTLMLLKLWEHYKASGYLSARILDHITDCNARYVDRQIIIDLIDTLPEKPFEILCIHDCFRCLPNYGNELRKQYNLQLALIAKSDMLAFILSGVLCKPITIEKVNLNMWLDVLNADYALS